VCDKTNVMASEGIQCHIKINSFQTQQVNSFHTSVDSWSRLFTGCLSCCQTNSINAPNGICSISTNQEISHNGPHLFL